MVCFVSMPYWLTISQTKNKKQKTHKKEYILIKASKKNKKRQQNVSVSVLLYWITRSGKKTPKQKLAFVFCMVLINHKVKSKTNIFCCLLLCCFFVFVFFVCVCFVFLLCFCSVELPSVKNVRFAFFVVLIRCKSNKKSNKKQQINKHVFCFFV